MVKISDGVIRVCTSSLTLRRAKISLLFIECLGLADSRSVYFSKALFSFLLVAISFLRIGLIYLEFRVSLYFLFAVSLPLVFSFSG